MSRALRRQPLVQKPPSKTPGFRPGARPVRRPASAGGTTAAAQPVKKGTLYDRYMPRFFQDIISELKKVSWPTREETTRLTVVVVVVSVAIGLLLGGVDISFNWFVDNTLLR